MSNNHFPHDGEGGCTHGRCTGYGWNCDENNYGYHGSGHRRSGGATLGFLLLIIICSAIGAWNELIGALILLVGAFIIWTCR